MLQTGVCSAVYCTVYYKEAMHLFDKSRAYPRLRATFFRDIVTPILLYGSEIWAYEKNYMIEKLYLRYCKYILSVNKIGRLSIEYLIHIKMYFILGSYYFRPSFKTVSKNV